MRKQKMKEKKVREEERTAEYNKMKNA